MKTPNKKAKPTNQKEDWSAVDVGVTSGKVRVDVYQKNDNVGYSILMEVTGEDGEKYTKVLSTGIEAGRRTQEWTQVPKISPK